MEKGKKDSQVVENSLGLTNSVSLFDKTIYMGGKKKLKFYGSYFVQSTIKMLRK